MFFWLVSREDEAVNWSEWIPALDNLGEAGFKRDHLVLGDRQVLEQVKSLTGLSRKAQMYFASAFSRLTTLGSVAGLIEPVEVDPGVRGATCLGGRTVVPLATFLPENSAERAMLLCEHMHDCKVVEEFARIRLTSLGLQRTFRLALRPASGGGGGIHLTLRTYQTDPLSLGICVVDSDRGHPRDALGTTARTCARAFQVGWKWALHIICGRELENLIPPELAREAGFANLRKVDYYKDELWAIGGYVDFKVADHLCRFFQIEKSCGSYREVRLAISELAHGLAFGNICCVEEECVGMKPCELNHLHPNMLEKIANWLTPAGASTRIGRITTTSAFDELASHVVRAGLAPAFPIV